MKLNWNHFLPGSGTSNWFLILPFIFLIQVYAGLPVLGQPIPKTESLFDGITLKGWKTVDPTHEKLWYVADSTIISGDGVQKIPDNRYLYTRKEYGDFEFRCLFRLTGDPSTGMINSGIQYRSLIEGGKMVGYQADIGNGYWGDIYDEHRRGKLAAAI